MESPALVKWKRPARNTSAATKAVAVAPACTRPSIQIASEYDIRPDLVLATMSKTAAHNDRGQDTATSNDQRQGVGRVRTSTGTKIGGTMTNVKTTTGTNNSHSIFFRGGANCTV